MNKEQKTRIILLCTLVLALIVLLLLAAAVVDALNPDKPVSDDPRGDTLDVKNISGMNLREAVDLLSSVGIKYEIVRTDSRLPNRVEKIEYEGSEGDGYISVNVGTTVKLYANEVSSDKVIYLTFDDGPTRDNTFDILDMLDHYGIKASFFVLGNRIEEFSDRIEDTVLRGHALGCHSFSHNLDRGDENYIYASVDTMLGEIEKYEKSLRNVLGDKADGIKKLFRFPGGSNSRINGDEALEYIARIRERGYGIYDWSALTGDAEGNGDAQSMLSTLKSSLERAKNANDPLIVLLHDKGTTKEALSDILDYLVGEGYYFDTVDNAHEYVFAE